MLSLSYVLFMHIFRYVPPLTASSPKLPETPEEIQQELCKQESLLNQIHSEMNSGFVSKKREEQLWEVQRIITQLKRKLKTFERKNERSIEDADGGSIDTMDSAAKPTIHIQKSAKHDDEHSMSTKSAITGSYDNTSKSPKAEYSNKDSNEISLTTSKVLEHTPTSPLVMSSNNADGLYIDEDTGLLMICKSHPDYSTLIRLQLENQELLAWKSQLQARISAERAEILRLKHLQQQIGNKMSVHPKENSAAPSVDDYERIVEHYMRENTLLEHKKQMLSKEIFEEHKQCIALQVELAMQKY